LQGLNNVDGGAFSGLATRFLGNKRWIQASVG
jgi:hypothetical protein